VGLDGVTKESASKRPQTDKEYGSLIGSQTRHLIPKWHHDSISSRPCALSFFLSLVKHP
jgi:hypothetical protein